MSTCGASTRFNPDVLGRLLFTMGTSTIAEGEIMGRWAFEEKGWKSAFLLQDPTLAYNKDLCRGMKDSFPKQSGASIAGETTFKGTDPKFGAQIEAIKKADPDFIWLCAATPAGPTALKQLRAAGVDTPVLSGAAMDGSYWIKTVPDLSNFHYSTYGSIFGDDPREAVNEFVEKEKTLTGDPPVTSFDMTGYALLEAVKIAIEEAESADGNALADVLETFREKPLLTGPNTFTDDSHLNGVRPMAIVEVQNGKYRFDSLFPPGQ
jgi:branched-chain amino acid transport system substrate-binding protein